jgi:hypothetical protein
MSVLGSGPNKGRELIALAVIIDRETGGKRLIQSRGELGNDDFVPKRRVLL